MGRDARRQQIFDAAIGIFARYGYEHASLEKVAAKLKITKPALYLYFKNKEDLFLSMVFQRFDETLKEVEKLVAMQVSGREKLRLYIKGNIEFLCDNVDVFHLMQGPPKSLFKRLEKGFNEKTRRIYDLVIRILRQCREEGLFNEKDDTFLLQSLLGLVHGSFGLNLNRDLKKVDFQRMAERILAFFVKGAGG
jgi:TetR/AcrR family fatty acid metabolism transcriptional regulator